MYDPQEAEREFGPAIAGMLKTDKSVRALGKNSGSTLMRLQGQYILWPQPDDSPDDPQTWSDRKKTLMLVIIAMAAFGAFGTWSLDELTSAVPDFDSGLGIASLFPLAAQYNTTTGEINKCARSGLSHGSR